MQNDIYIYNIKDIPDKFEPNQLIFIPNSPIDDSIYYALKNKFKDQFENNWIIYAQSGRCKYHIATFMKGAEYKGKNND